MFGYKGGIMKPADAIIVVKDMLKAADAKDLEKIASYFTDDLVYEDVPEGGVIHGKKELINMIKMVLNDFPDRKIELVSAFSDGHKVASEAIWSGTFTHSSNPKRTATGKFVSLKYVSISELRDGKICKNSDYYDGLSMARQAGILPNLSSK
jgi:steroid delta-isomerase-like uncharacterized protein